MACWTSIPDSIYKIPLTFKSNILDVNGKAEHACALNTRQQIACWGQDHQGETAIPPRFKYVNHVATGIFLTCALVDHRYSLECWGIVQITLISNKKQIKQIVLAHPFICSLYDDGMYFCGEMQVKNEIIEFEQPEGYKDDIKHISGMRSICAVKNSGDLKCWDPVSLVNDQLLPKQSKDVKVVETNQFKTCVITNSNAMKCWAYNFKPTIIADFRKNIKNIQTKGPIICAIRLDNQLSCWIAYGNRKPMSDYQNTDSVSIQYNPSDVNSFKIQVLFKSKELKIVNSIKKCSRDDIPKSYQTEIIKIDSGHKHFCAIKETPTSSSTPVDTGTLGCFGNNHYGESDIPTSFTLVSTIALGDHHTCAISPRMLACWGNNRQNQTTVPVQFRQAFSIHTTSHTCALVFKNAISRVGCWGNNTNGQATVPEQVVGGDVGDKGDNMNSNINRGVDLLDSELVVVRKEMVAVSTGREMSGAVDTAGELHMWGKSEYAFIPEKQRQGVAEVVSNEMTCVLRKDKTVGCWGKVVDT